jgi:DNA-damage-inducible protein J
MKNSVIRARIDSDLKARASKVLASCGLEPSDAIRLFLQQVVAHQGIPFEVRRGGGPEPSLAELREMKRRSQARDRRIAASEDMSGGELFLIRPDQARGAKVRWPKARLG